MANKVVVITGVNSGLGLETAKSFVEYWKRGHHGRERCDEGRNGETGRHRINSEIQTRGQFLLSP
ncbi:NAD(P)-dependent dehydrogenase (short-subunit alcohol dehydrogenase family) [Evansella vedderi]|uniref:NAD(P)-dependent dehydrogenase (Short-subunit alcohol dehydrogenase family) n=1 Tax=Evansella vedderi TaxID=38282 RepID=A0ABU0A2R4_9BACI|nr:hypothetical protein [Evansella vedderi]MDQ0257777.1 NAD(P)-dependent dehydrogenase (short-subunit alcohol dehydrogenase family) [Evansella vedderi]